VAVLTSYDTLLLSSGRTPRPWTHLTGEGGIGRVLWITGPRCVGSSTVGWLVATDRWQKQSRTGFIDIAQLSFTWNLDVPVGLTNGVALCETFADDGAELFVLVAPLEIEPVEVRAAFNHAEVSVIRLDATDADLHSRALSRTRGEGPRLPGDDLSGASVGDAHALIASAVARQRIDVRPGEIPIDTSGTDASASKSMVATAARW
jgi:hypothetical protein